MKSSTTLVLLFVCLFGSTLFLQPVIAYKKKLIGAMMLGALIGSKPKLLPLPLILPIPIKHERVKYVPYQTVKYVPMPEPYPVYHSYGGSGHYESGGHSGGHYESGGHYGAGHY